MVIPKMMKLFAPAPTLILATLLVTLVSPGAKAQNPALVECIKTLTSTGVSGDEALIECKKQLEQPVSTPKPQPSSTPKPQASALPNTASLTGTWILDSPWFFANARTTSNCLPGNRKAVQVPIQMVEENAKIKVLTDLDGYRNREGTGGWDSAELYLIVTFTEATRDKNQISATWEDSTYPTIKVSGTLSPDGQKISGTATCGSRGTQQPFTLTRQP